MSAASGRAFPVWVDGDPMRLAQALGNLLHNAAKFTDAGGQVGVQLSTEGSSARVCVSDTGMGIPPELLPHVFDVFVQADRGLHRSHGGLGLGLTLVKGLIELHGGQTDVRSDGPGRGAEFSFALALAPGASPDHEASPALGGASASLRVLIIEENEDAAQSLAEVLEANGYAVAVAGTGSQGIAPARDFRPAVILCDLGLPQMDGYAVATALRADPAFQRTRLIAVSGYGQEVDIRRARAAGFDAPLTKPVAFPMLQCVLVGTPGDA